MTGDSLLDARTLFLTQPIIHLIAAFWLHMVARTGRRVEGLTTWSVANLCYAAGLILIGLRDRIPDPVSITAANGMILCGYLATHAGVLQFARLSLRPLAPLAVACAAVLSLHAWFTYVVPDTALRVAVMTAGLGLLSPVTAWRLFTSMEPAVRPAARAVGVTYLFWSAFCLFRAGWTWFSPNPDDPLYGDPVQEIATLVAIIIAASASQGYLWMAGMRLEAELFRQSRHDPLTGVMNRRGAWEVADVEVARALRHERPLAVLQLDLDRFKLLNDRLGHAAGDRALVALTERVQALLRRSDLMARAGGEEFIVLLPETGRDEALAVAERIRASVEQMRIPHEGATVAFTVSIGVATLGDDAHSWEPLLAAADTALYLAKSNGRNRVEVAATTAQIAERAPLLMGA
ncbi:MAG TPA: GGDEF domain-containing protein [Azospirillaceae bacterium]|nr:GGDEF domain-containing protein [Azospirillaceae bacterium]